MPDTSTISPDAARAIGEVATAAGATYLDTPVLGRPELVGGWTIPVGGPAAEYDAAVEVLTPLAVRVVHVGDLGAAATIKVANNVLEGFAAIDEGRRVLESTAASAGARRRADDLIWEGNLRW